MSTSSPETDHHAPSSGRESTESLLFSLPSDSSDVQTEITPPTSPTACEGNIYTPRDILDASRRLAQTPALATSALHGDTTPSAKATKQLHHHHAPSKSSVKDEAGYDADGDGDCDVDDGHDQDARTGTSDEPITTTRLWTRPVSRTHTQGGRRPAFPRIDTRQHRRVASMLTPADLKTAAAANTNASVDAESYELRQRSKPRLGPTPKRGWKATDAELVGLGIGFPDDHPLRAGRAFSMPVTMMAAMPPVSASAPVLSPAEDPGSPEGQEAKAYQHHMHQESRYQERRRFEWLSSPIKWRRERKTLSVSMTRMTAITTATATQAIPRCDETDPFGEPKTSALVAVKSGFPTAKTEVEEGRIAFQPRDRVGAA